MCGHARPRKWVELLLMLILVWHCPGVCVLELGREECRKGRFEMREAGFVSRAMWSVSKPLKGSHAQFK